MGFGVLEACFAVLLNTMVAIVYWGFVRLYVYKGQVTLFGSSPLCSRWGVFHIRTDRNAVSVEWQPVWQLCRSVGGNRFLLVGIWDGNRVGNRYCNSTWFVCAAICLFWVTWCCGTVITVPYGGVVGCGGLAENLWLVNVLCRRLPRRCAPRNDSGSGWAGASD